MLATPDFLMSPDTLAGPITDLVMDCDEEAVDFLLSPSLGAVDEGVGEVTDALASAVEGDEAGDDAELCADIWDIGSWLEKVSDSPSMENMDSCELGNVTSKLF